MKTIITSNWRPLRRALCTLLIGIAALWAMPRSARAQIYVSQEGNNTVGVYNGSTGAAINANFITGLSNPTGLALSGNALFGLGTLFVTNGGGTVGTYDVATGAAINANFITGLSGPEGLALFGNDLFVANSGSGTVGEYNAQTGVAINANLITGVHPIALALSLSGKTLFVTNSANDTVGEYNATTGAAINANFITRLDGPVGLAVAPAPEPSTWSMIAVGGVALLGMMLRKKHRTA